MAAISYIGNGVVIACYFFGGWLMDIIGRRRTFQVTGVLGTLAFLFFCWVAVIQNVVPTSETIFRSPVFFSILFLQMGYAYFGGQGAWLSELYPTHLRATGLNLVYYVSRALGAGIAPLMVLSCVTAWGYDVRVASLAHLPQ